MTLHVFRMHVCNLPVLDRVIAWQICMQQNFIMILHNEAWSALTKYWEIVGFPSPVLY